MLKFHMKEPNRFRLLYFSNIVYGHRFAHAKPQLDPSDERRVSGVDSFWSVVGGQKMSQK